MRKAVSPVIATLLLILIAVAAAVLVYVWVTGYASSVTSSGTPELQERIKIDTVDVAPGGESITIYVRNIGSTTIEGDDLTEMMAYIIDVTSGQIQEATSTGWTEQTGNGDTNFEPGEVFKITISGLNLQEGRTYIAKVVTPSGVEAALSFSYEA